MRDDWGIKTLEDGFMKDSSNLSINKLKDDDGDYPFYSAKGFVKNISFYHQEKSYLAIIKDGAGVGRVSIHPAKSSVVGTLQYLLPKEGFDLKFLYYYLLSVDFSKYFTGSTIPHIYFKDYKSEPFPVVALEEQKEIVEILDQAFESIEKAKANIEKNIENAKELFQSKLNQMFSQVKEGWVSVSLKNIGIIQTGSTPSTKDKSNYGNHIPFVKPPHFNKNGTLNTGESMLSESGLKKSRLIKANSVLMVCIGATIGKTAFTEQDICTNQQINALTSNDNYIPKLLYYGMISPTFQNKVKSEGRSSQATLPIINKSKWSNLEIILPQNISKQKKLVETLDIIDNHIESVLLAYKEELKNLEELKKSILQKAFNGELTNKNKAA